MMEKLPEVSFYYHPNEPRVSVIGVKLLSIKPSDFPSPIDCVYCGGSRELIIRSAEYPFRESGFIVRFDELPQYRCDSETLTTVPPGAGKLMQMAIDHGFTIIPESLRIGPQVSVETLEKILKNTEEPSKDPNSRTDQIGLPPASDFLNNV